MSDMALPIGEPGSNIAAAASGRVDPRTVLELLKPITWFAPMWAFGCGVISSGVPLSGHGLRIAAGIALAGPLVCGASQAANDWFDRDVDALNEPGRPIPSGRIPGRMGLHIALVWSAVSLIVAAALGPWTSIAALIGVGLGWAYSAPPLRLKLNGWWGNAACGACYEGLPWLTGSAVMAAGAPDGRMLAVAALYSLGAHGIMTLNDFKSIEGDRRMGVLSLPVQLGAGPACRAACAFMIIPQLLVVALLLHWGETLHALCVSVLIVIQLALMVRLLGDPRRLAPWYNATGTTLYVLGMLTAALAMQAGH